MILNIVNLNILTLLLEPVSSATADFNTYFNTFSAEVIT